MFCDQCGVPLPPGAVVCANCGAVLETPQASSASPATPATLAAPSGWARVAPGSVLEPPPVAPAPVNPLPNQAPLTTAPPAPPAIPQQPMPPNLMRPPPPVSPPHPGVLSSVLDARPGSWPSARAWFAAAMLRNLRGIAAGIFGAWFNVPFVLLMAAVGALFGGLAGVVSGTFAGPGVTGRIDDLLNWVFPIPFDVEELLPTFGAQVGGIVGGLLGAVSGGFILAYAAFVWPWMLLSDGDPMWPVSVAVGQVLTALLVGFAYTLWSVAFEGWRLKLQGARRPSRREMEFLWPIVDEAATRLGVVGRPRLLINDGRDVNAMAGARHIVIYQGLLDEVQYRRDAIAAVVAHELVHWRHGDPIAMAWAKGVALPLYLLYELATRLLQVSRTRPLQWLIRFLLWSVMVTVKGVVIPLQAKTWREAEYRADAGAAGAGYAEGLRFVLGRMRGTFDGSRSGWDKAVCGTHPPYELRLERIEEPGKTYALPDDNRPEQPTAVRITSDVEWD